MDDEEAIEVINRLSEETKAFYLKRGHCPDYLKLWGNYHRQRYNAIQLLEELEEFKRYLEKND